MSKVDGANLQIGDSGTASQNCTLTANGDGSFTLARGNIGATTDDLLTIDANGVSVVNQAYIKLSDVKPSGTAGGTFTSGAWQTRILNTEDNDTGNHCSLASNQFTLAAGTYRILSIVPAYYVQSHKSKLYNITDSSDEIIGTSEITSITTGAQTQSSSSIVGEFTIASTKTFEVQHRGQTTKATDGFGRSSGFGVSEIYAVVELWKVK